MLDERGKERCVSVYVSGALLTKVVDVCYGTMEDEKELSEKLD